MFSYYNHLGFNNPYYYNNCDNKFVIKKNLSELLANYNGERKIDPIAMVELLNYNFVFADRTIIQGIQRTPWLARPNQSLNEWKYFEAPIHDLLYIEEEEIAKTLFKKICSEIQLYIGDKKKVGLLLSGGMDSRMVAGALDYLIKTNKISEIEVTGLTWGNTGTRDVIYAKEITSRLNWNWKHYTVTAKDLLNNIKETALNGCEYSPIQLHAIPQIRDDNTDLEVILAGSYGDSMGRGEYFGWKVKYLRPISCKLSNIGSLLFQEVFDDTIKQIKQDVDKYHNQFPEKESYVQNELDYQLHYMRRMLNPCMELLRENCEFHQVFTHPDVYGYIWSINPKKRNDLVYKYMLNEFKTKLSDIPWARTGLPYGQKKGKPDNYLKDHHSYAHIIRDEIIGDIEVMILSPEILKLNVFNIKSIKKILKLIKLFPPNHLFYLEMVIWLASIAKMCSLYSLEGLDNNHRAQSPNKLKINSIILEYLYYFIRRNTGPFIKKIIQKI